MNLYTYCYISPLNYTDPSGNIPWDIIPDIISIGKSLYDFIKKPSWKNAGYLVWDVAFAFIPYVPGSYVAKGTKVLSKVDDVVDTAKIISKADDVADASKLLSKANNISDAVGEQVRLYRKKRLSD